MAKMVGMNVVIKQGWTKKAVALLDEQLTEEQYKATLNEHLSFEIDSAINLRKAREILMRVWFRDTEGLERLQAEGRALAVKYPDQLAAINWCMTALVFPAFADIAKLMGKMFEFQDVITTTQIKQKMFDEWGETGTLQTVVSKIVGTMREIGGISSEKAGWQEAAHIQVNNEEVISFMLRVAMTLDGSGYYTFSSLTEFSFLFPFEYRMTKEQLMQDEKFTLSTFDAALCAALK